MPELPEVQTVVNTLRPRLVGRTIRGVKHLRDDIVRPCGFDLARALRARTITSVERRGKRIMFTLDGGEQFSIHLGMTGRLTVEEDAADVAKHTHFVASLGSGAQLRFRDPRRFGGIFWIGSEPERPNDRSELGPEPLKLRPRRLAELLSRTTRAIKNALLDQRLVAGLGNIYVDESLFLARIHPLTRADRLTGEQVRRLNRAIKLTLRRAIRHRGSTLRDYVDGDGQAGRFQRLHRVYDHGGDPCTVCGTPISRIVLGGRSTHFCRRCQPISRSAAVRFRPVRASYR